MTANNVRLPNMRWRDYTLIRGGDFTSFWTQHGNEAGRKLLFIVGRGFDPRATLGLNLLLKASSKCPIDVLAIQLSDEASGMANPHRLAVESNWAIISGAVDGRGTVTSREVQFQNKDGRRTAARNAANVLADEKIIEGYTDVVVDISAMPRVVYFPLISRLIYFHDEYRKHSKTAPNIHVLVAEDPHLDAEIKEYGVDETASFLHPYEGPFIRESQGGHPTVWIPVLGEGRTIQFDRIYDLVKPDEVCPVLPSPARDPRRSDNIIMEYQSLLFDQIRIDPRNIIYGSEFNPFDIYRQVYQTCLHYHRVLGLIGGCKMALSAMCSKVMSLGVLLVAYELKSSPLHLGIAHIECQRYEMPANPSVDVEYVDIWIAGECYN